MKRTSKILFAFAVFGAAVFGSQSATKAQAYADIDSAANVSVRLIQQSISAFRFDPTIQTSQKVENTGNVDAEVASTITIRSFFGDAEMYTDTKAYLIHPRDSSDLAHNWDTAPQVGLFRVHNEVSLPDKDYIKDGIVIIIPIWLFVWLMTSMIGFILCIVYSVKVSKNRKANKSTNK